MQNPHGMDDHRLQSLTAATFVRLADLLSTVDAAAWDGPSLCEEWTVREVVAHMTTAARVTGEQFGHRMQAAGGDMAVVIDDLAREGGRLPITELLASLRSPDLHAWTPPGGGQVGALTHVVIHGLDVSRPAGLAPAASQEALLATLDVLAAGLHRAFGVDLTGTRVEATDLDWTYADNGTAPGNGSGESVHLIAGPAADLVLMLSGRRLPEETPARTG